MYDYIALFYLLKCCLCVLSLYPITHTILFLNEQFRILNYNKRCYVVKNIIKSSILFYLVIEFINSLMYRKTIWDSQYLHNVAGLYVSNDIIGLLIIPHLPITTKCHHIMTSILVIYSFSIDFTQDNVGRWMLIYTYMSCLSFGVNAYLGLRFLITDGTSVTDIMIDYLRIFSFYIYLICCIINWSIHIFLIIDKLLFDYLTFGHIFYLIFLIPIIRDDIVLMTWLHTKYK
jgi:hypothetical protein